MKQLPEIQHISSAQVLTSAENLKLFTAKENVKTNIAKEKEERKCLKQEKKTERNGEIRETKTKKKNSWNLFNQLNLPL